MVSRSQLGILHRALIACTLLFLGTVAAIFIAGLFLPGHVEIQRVVKINASRARLHPLLNDLERWREWNTWGDSDGPIVLQYSDLSSGVGAWHSWRSDESGAGRIEITASDPTKGVWYDMTFDLDPDPMKGALRYLPEGESAGGEALELEWSLRGELSGPLERALGPVIAWRVGADFDKNLATLSRLLDENQ
jgi:hypothetical protein